MSKSNKCPECKGTGINWLLDPTTWRQVNGGVCPKCIGTGLKRKWVK